MMMIYLLLQNNGLWKRLTPPKQKKKKQPVRSHLVQPMSYMVQLQCTEPTVTVCYGKGTVTIPTQG